MQRLLVTVVFVVGAVASAAPADDTVVDSSALYKDPKAPIPARVSDLLGRMTIEEKIAQLFCPYASTFDKFIKLYGKTGWGSIRSQNPEQNNELQKSVMASSRLGIPVAFIHESLHGGYAGGTVFPMPLTMGMSWNTSLVADIYSVVANETRAGGANIAFAPVINLFSDPRFGRHQEGFSPNPTLTAHMATASVLGLQGSTTGNATTYLDNSHVVALGKHFAAYGAALGGLNGQPATFPEHTIRDVYLKPWRAFGKAGGRGAMPSHQTVLGVPCHANDFLVNQIFREEYGFGLGLTISDCNDLGALQDFGVAANTTQAAALGLKGGVDQDLQCGSQATYSFASIKQALALGLAEQVHVDNAVTHVLTMKFASGLFDTPSSDPTKLQYLDNPEHRHLARVAAREGVTLVQNDGALPLSKTDLASAVVVGPLGDNARSSMLGSYTSDDGKIPVRSIREALSNVTGANVPYEAGADTDKPSYEHIAAAMALAQKAPTIIVALGDSLNSCGEWHDRSSLDLPGSQLQLLGNLTQLEGKKIVVVLINGRPATFGDVDLSKVNAILVAGRPGEEGGNAIAEILSGAVNPSGKLGSSWPRTVGHVGSGSSPWYQPIAGKWLANGRGPADPDGRRYDNYVDDPLDPTPLFYFGFGLSYTTFSYDHLKAQVGGTAGKPTIEASVTITNTGHVDGAEVAQFYVKDPAGASLIVRPWKRLAAFTKVFLRSGQSTEVKVTVSFDDLAQHDVRMQFGVARGSYTLSVGGSSRDALQKTTVAI
eukprot:m.88884 g.88884  ORF g.88884 m.88884 type:complete len:769 (+) comp14957_c0_seq2:241-2547(+)